MITTLGLKNYGDYIFNISIIESSAFLLPSINMVGRKFMGFQKLKPRIFLLVSFSSVLIFSFLTFGAKYYEYSFETLIFFIGLTTVYLSTYDSILLGMSKVFLSRVLMLLSSISFLLLISIFDYNLIELLYLFFTINFIRNILGFLLVFFFKSNKKDITLKEMNSYFLTSFKATFLHSIYSRADNLIIGFFSPEGLSIYHSILTLYKSVKNNISYLYINELNSIITFNKQSWMTRLLNLYKKNIQLIIPLVICFWLASYVYTLYLGISKMIFVCLILSVSLILNIITEINWYIEIYGHNAKNYSKYYNYYSTMNIIFLSFLVYIFDFYGAFFSLLILNGFTAYLSLKVLKNLEYA